LQQVLGNSANDVAGVLNNLTSEGMTPAQIGLTLEAIVQGRELTVAVEDILDLVLSGPEVEGVPTRDTAASFNQLIEAGEREIVLVGYAVHNGKRIFERLADRMRAIPKLDVIFHLDIPRRQNDSSLSEEIVRRFANDFKSKHWPLSGERLPSLYYDPRSLEEGFEKRASLHAKCLIIDRSTALVTSANFTDAAHRKNVEVGVLIYHRPTVIRLWDYFHGLRRTVFRSYSLSPIAEAGKRS
jgi:hypothetical protein